MKFSCDSCGATYMISDEKVGSNGVRVRCKKCGNQITVRRPGEAPVLERPAPAAPAPAPGRGLDEELGSAFDQAFGDRPAASAPAPAGPAPAASAAAAPALAPQEWYVAIGEAQVGPLPLAEVKKRWEAGDIGPDSLVWRPGMTEWGPLAGVPELAAFLAPVPQPSAPSPAPAATVFAAPAGRPAAPQARPAAPGPDVEWKPTGASALAALASEELASRAPSPVAAPAAHRSIMEQLPDSGGVDPTGAIPLPIKAMERTDERPVRRSSVARGAQELRHKRNMRTVVMVAVLAVVVVAGGAFAWVQLSARPAPPVPVAVQPTPPPADLAPAPPPPAPVPTPAVAGNAVAEAPAAVAAPPPPAPPPPETPAAKPAAAPASKKAKAPAAAPARPARQAVAQATPAPRPAAEKPAAKKKDGLLDFDQGGEDDLAAALGSGTGGRKVYVPPAVGGAAAAPDRLSDAQIMEAVKLHSDDLQRCVSEQRAREPGAKGTIKVAWLIALDGAPRDVRCITPEYAQGEFARCLVGVVRTIRFPRISDPKGQSITFPFQF
jgi:predicted Zn finger-like uncharacterized protein